MADEYPETIREELEYLAWERKHPEHFKMPFTMWVPACTPDHECEALAKTWGCIVKRETQP